MAWPDHPAARAMLVSSAAEILVPILHMSGSDKALKSKQKTEQIKKKQANNRQTN